MNIFETLNHSIRDERWWSGVTNHLHSIFLKNFDGVYNYGKNVNLESRNQSDEVVNFCLDKINEYCQSESTTCTYFETNGIAIFNNKILLLIKRDGGKYEQLPNAKFGRFNFDAFGDLSIVNNVLNSIRDKFYDKSFTRVTWYYKDMHGVDGCALYIEHDSKVKDEYYPWLTSGVDTFINEYLNSKASVLVLYGPPGTGKTSFLKHMLCDKKLNAAISYDEAVLNDDRFFIDFLTSEDNDVLIIEDADNLLTSREVDHNKIMNKFLNVSEGLVKINNKKMVFTTNISQLNTVDQALLRKGRCFSAVEFRKMTNVEAPIAAKAANQPDQDWSSQKEWSLAEIFNSGNTKIVETQRKQQFGFAR